MDSLTRHLDYLEGEWRAAQAAPLSARKAVLVAMLIDAYVDRMFAALPEAGDILEYRAKVAATSPALRLVMALCSRRHGVDLVTEAVQVPIADYGKLSEADFMVSLYNDHSVQRVRIVGADGERRDMHEVLREAMEALGLADRR